MAAATRCGFCAFVLLLLLLLLFNKRRWYTSTKSYVINLDRRPDRMRLFNNTSGDVRVRRVSAVDGALMPLDAMPLTPEARLDVMRGYRTAHEQLTRGAVGCWLSHLKVWRLIAESSNNRNRVAVVFEDDAVLTPVNVREMRNRLTRPGATPPDEEWDVLLFGDTGAGEDDGGVGGTVVVAPDGHTRWIRVDGFLMLHAYALRPRTARRLLRRADLTPFDVQIDWYLSRLIEQGALRVYAVAPPAPVVRTTRNDDTDIQNKILF